MKTLNKCILCFFCSLYSILAIAQVPQELLDKAKAAGMTEEQIDALLAANPMTIFG